MKDKVATFLSLARFHIVLIAAAGSLVFGWLLTGRFHPWMALVVGIDWFIINLMNRGADTREDAINAIRGAETAARHQRALYLAGAGLLAATLLAHLVWRPALVLPRLGVHLLGFVYNFPLLRTRDGRPFRLKTLYGLKNTASCAGFLITLFLYPLVSLPLRDGVGPAYVLLLVAYFAPFEYSFEVIYDLRDVRGDAAHGVRSFPVVKGRAWTARLIVLLNLFSLHALVWGAAFGLLGLKEVILGVGPLVQLALFQHGRRHGFTAGLCTTLTYLFFGMLAGYVVWVVAGMPLTLGYRPTPAGMVEVGLIVPGLLLWRSRGAGVGAGRFLLTYATIGFAAWIGEQSAISLYQYYSYAAGGWHLFAGDVPLAVVAIWPMLILSTRALAHRLGFRDVRAALFGAGLTLLEATFVEVVCMHAGLWAWRGTGVLGVPIIGVVGWSAFAFGVLLVLETGPLAMVPVAGPAVVHVVVPVLWHAGFNRISSAPIPDHTVLAGAALLSIVMAAVALRARGRADIGLSEVLPRFAAAELIALLLPLSSAPGRVVAFAVLFAVPYLALFRLR